MKKIVQLLFCVAMVILTGCEGSTPSYDDRRGFTIDAPHDVVKKYISAVQRADFNELRTLTKGDALQEVGNTELMLSQLNSNEVNAAKIAVKYEAQNLSVTNKSTIKGNSASVWAMDQSQKKPTYILFTLARNDSSSPWYIYSIKSIKL